MAASPEEQLTLEDWLDGELGEIACSELRERLSGDPQLSAELARLQGERQTRSNFWQCCEPSTNELDVLASAIRRDCLKHQVAHERFRMFRNTAAIAATFAVVFGSGWMSRGRVLSDKLMADRVDRVMPVTTLADNTAGPAVTPRNWPVATVGNFSMPAGTPWPNESSLPGYPVDSTGLATRRPTYRLVLVDPLGTPIDSQEVDDVRDPQKLKARFAEFENRLQDAQHSVTTVNQFTPWPQR